MKGLAIIVAGALLASVEANEEACRAECKSRNVSKDLVPCNEGCNGFYASKTFSKLNEGAEEIDKIMELCRHSCDDAFVQGNESEKQLSIQACKNGCGIAAETQNQVQAVVHKQSKPKNIFDIVFGDDIFSGLESRADNHRNGGLTISFGMPSMMRNDEFSIPNHMKEMMQSMHSSMNQMFNNIRQNMPSLPTLNSSGGKMVMIKAGPGYHEEKTYDIGPNGKMTLIKNDMMDRRNPLDDQAEPRDVEIFDPVPNQKNEIWNDIDQELAKIVRSDEEESRKEKEFVEPILKEIDESIAKHAIYGNEPWDGPRLPEHGLRSRDMCHMDSKLMKWSDWVSCLHRKLNMPRWLMTSTLCLGIIFLLWLCLVIPNNAPKQRVKKMSPKEAEALAVVTVEKQSYAKEDLPPKYEEVANLSVQLEPVHQEVKKPEVSA